jgi:hypothetical protein
MLKSRDLASVATKLQVPLIVSDILNGAEELTDDVEYALHEAISELQPDSALLCIALCGAKLANAGGKSPSMRVLEIECRKIVDEYALLWLHNAEGSDVDEDQAFETLSGAQEDLEDLSGLLDNCLNVFEHKNPDAAIICNILSIQASAQAVIAEAYFEAIGIEPVVPEVPILASNIIPFPLHKTA